MAEREYVGEVRSRFSEDHGVEDRTIYLLAVDI